MKVVQRYQCELCKADHDTEKEAKECEKKHPKSIEIVDLVFDEHRVEPTTVVLKWGKIPGITAMGARYTLSEFITKEKQWKTTKP